MAACSTRFTTRSQWPRNDSGRLVTELARAPWLRLSLASNMAHLYLALGEGDPAGYIPGCTAARFVSTSMWATHVKASFESLNIGVYFVQILDVTRAERESVNT